MAAEPEPHSKRARSRSLAKRRREASAAWRESSFDALASGFSLQQIAEARSVRVRTIRREVDRAVAAKRLDAPDRYVHLQVARLTKALRLADVSIERGDLRAIAALTKVVAALDCYHGLQAPSRPTENALLPAPPAPPLALAHAAPPMASLATELERVTVFGA